MPHTINTLIYSAKKNKRISFLNILCESLLLIHSLLLQDQKVPGWFLQLLQ